MPPATPDWPPKRPQRIGELEVLRKEVERLAEESEALTRQLLQSFEELSLLRSLSEHLELGESVCKPIERVHGILSELRLVVDAESLLLALLPTEPSTADSSRTELELHWFGPHLLTAAQCHEFIGQQRGPAAEHPVVRNHAPGAAQPEVFPGLREFVLTEIRNRKRLGGWLVACNRPPHADRPPPLGFEGFSSAEATLLFTAASMLAAALHNATLLRQKELLFTDMVRALVNATEARDSYTRGHSERVALMARRLGREIGLPFDECERLYLAGLLHDVGKISIPDTLLRKPGRLSDGETQTFRSHPDAAWAILQELAALRHVLPGVLHHHERFDGQGYPDRLAGESIPLDARILAVCDSYDAMTSDRPYRQGMPHDQAVDVLRTEAGSQFDPRVIAAFHSATPDLLAIRRGYGPPARPARPRSPNPSDLGS